ncbi:hypothetical protein E2C01_017173 [Portunus trituberculatus]|uniref:Uncharacterized protein n=1 Tax=Portunus trituberculatus TaxID=210409 RepID=A0A5B7DQW4_PORTR|nr:hypothetical protein [Portunus trituberculatus]
MPGGDGGGHVVTALYLPGRAGRHLQRVEQLQQGLGRSLGRGVRWGALSGGSLTSLRRSSLSGALGRSFLGRCLLRGSLWCALCLCFFSGGSLGGGAFPSC